MADKTLELLFETIKDLTTAVYEMRQEINIGFQQVNEQFQQVNEQFQQVNERLDRIEHRLRNLEGESDHTKIRLFDVERELKEMKRM